MNSQQIIDYGYDVHASQQVMPNTGGDIYKDAIDTIKDLEDPNQLPNHYAAVKNWIITTYPPDSIQYRELYRILYAFYFHSLVKMKMSGQVSTDVIKRFTDMYSGDHHRYHDQSKLKKALNSSSVSRLAQSSFSLKITKTTFHTLVTYLTDNHFIFFLGIVQDHLVVTYVPFERIQYAPDQIQEFILPVDSQSEQRNDPTLSLLKDNIMDLVNAHLGEIFGDKPDKKVELFDDDVNKRTSNIFPLPKILPNQIFATAKQVQLMAKLNKTELPTCAYFTFPDHDMSYDINNDGSLISVCTGTGIIKLISTNVYTDMDDLPIFKQITAQNERQSGSFELINQLMIPRYPVMYRDNHISTTTYFNRNLIGPKSYWSKFSPNSRFLLSGGLGFLRIWNCENSSIFSHIQTPLSVNWCGDWSPFSHQVAIGCEDNAALLYDLQYGEPIRCFNQHNKPIVDVKFHPNAFLLATCSCDCTIHLWDIKSGTSTRQLAHRMDVPRCMQFTRNGKILLSGDDSGAITAWDLQEGNKLGHVMAHNGPVRDIAISVEGTIIASCGDEGDILLWDIDNFKTSAIAQAKPLKKLQPRYGDTRRIKFSNTNLLLAMGSRVPAKA